MTTQQKLTKLQKELVDRYVLISLSYWTNHSTESKHPCDPLITGKIVDVKYVQKRFIVDVLYKEYNDNKMSWCLTKENYIRKMLQA